jgi:methylaspartate ammonia-lyase
MDTPQTLTITDTLLASTATAEGTVLSIGVAVEGQGVHWGDGYVREDPTAALATARRLLYLSTPSLVGQRDSSFRELVEGFRPIFPPHGIVPVADAVRGALHQAVLAAVAGARGRLPAEILAREYGLGGEQAISPTVPLILTVDDYAATAERFAQLLALRPDGIGYRLAGVRPAEAIGPNAELLQRFVRELLQRARQAGGETYQPTLYLGLAGSLGQLVDDPIRHIGKVLGHSVGLQEAAGNGHLLLEEPLRLDDPTAQAANLARLRDFLRRTPSTLKRGEPASLVARASELSDETFQQYVDTAPVNGVNFDLLAESDIHRLMTRWAALWMGGMDVYLTLPGSAEPGLTARRVSLAVDLALAGRAAGLILNFNDGDEGVYRAITRQLAEHAAILAIQ